MDRKTDSKMGKFLALILRHQPEVVGIKLDSNGWADVKELISGINKTSRYFTFEHLEEIVRTDNKQRYSFNEDKTKIRANQGHSVNVDVQLEEREPPEILYHGTGKKYIDSISKQGLLPQTRLYVHLSATKDTAEKVGQRHGTPHIYKVLSGQMHKDGYKFYKSVNGVWLTKCVPVKYLEHDGT